MLGRPAVVLVAVPGGAGNAAFQVLDPTSGAGEPIAFVRAEVGTHERSGTTHPLEREAELMRAAAQLGLPVARVLGVIDRPAALVMNVVAGTSRPTDEQVEQVAAEYMALIAALHRADPAGFPLEDAATVTEALRADLGRFHALALAGGVYDNPLIRLGEAVLRATMPESTHAPWVLHGDAGPGNFMVDRGHVSAILDWELSHVGDYHEDLAWMWMRGAHTAFGDPQTRLAEYAAASGREIDQAPPALAPGAGDVEIDHRRCTSISATRRRARARSCTTSSS